MQIAWSAAYCYTRGVVCLCVCCRERERCKNGWTDWDAVQDVDSRGSKEP